LLSANIDRSPEKNHMGGMLERERTVVRKVSKVSILQTARKIENDKVLTE